MEKLNIIIESIEDPLGKKMLKRVYDNLSSSPRGTSDSVRDIERSIVGILDELSARENVNNEELETISNKIIKLVKQRNTSLRNHNTSL